MKAIALTPGTTTLHLVDRPEPPLNAPDGVKLKVLEVGICGTDREEASGGRALAPEGQPELVIGHEMLGRVVETGPAVRSVKEGDYAVFTVRRGCRQCLSCRINRSDMCQTGNYRERGIWGLDGYQAEYAVDQEKYVVQVPSELAPVGVLAEPLSIVEKAIAEALRLQTARLPEAATTPSFLFRRRVLVAGLGPVGLLASMVLRLRGAEVYGLDIVEAGTARPQWLRAIGGQYVDGRQISPGRVAASIGPMDLILEATGIASLAFDLLDALALNGVYVVTGVPAGDRPLQIPGAELMRRLVLGNQVMVGSVNAARGHFQMAIDDLAHADLLWGGRLAELITRRHPWQQFAGPLTQHQPDEVKEVIEWSPVGSSAS